MFSWLKIRRKPKTVVLAQNITLTFAESNLHGDVVYDREREELTMVSNDYYEEISWYLSTSLWPLGRAPKRDHVLIKDWDEDSGLTAALVAARLVEITDTHTFGWRENRLYEVRVVIQKAS